MRLAVKVFVLTISLINQADALRCRRCKYCECSEDSAIVTCTGLVGSIPDCLPKNSMISLNILKSPEFTKIGRKDLRNYKKLQNLSIVETGLEEFHENALSELEDLETIEIVSAKSSKFTTFSNGTFSGRNKLRTIRVQDCSSFTTLQNGIFGNLNSLEVLELKGNKIQEVGEDILDQSVNVTSIDLSDNTHLENLPRNVFSRLKKLNSLVLTNCSLYVLYPEHVKTPYDSGSLEIFDGDDNYWQCDEMCEFVTWLQTAIRFRSIATMGYCSGSDYYQGTPVFRISPEDVCPHHVSVLLQTLLGVLFACVLALTCCFLSATCAAKYCKLGRCCNDTSDGTSRSTGNVAPVRQYRNQSYEQTDETRTAQFSNEAILQADCDVGDWNVNSIEPPLYDVVVGNDTSQSSQEKYYSSDSDCDIAPPPYDETETS